MADKKDLISLPGMIRIIQKMKNGCPTGDSRLGFLIGEKKDNVVIIKDVLIPPQKNTKNRLEISYSSVSHDPTSATGFSIRSFSPYNPDVVGVIHLDRHFKPSESKVTAVFSASLDEEKNINLIWFIGKNDEIFMVRKPNISIILKA
ncbi:MAG: hypothetical protein PHT40_02335 [Patescibacteria group bacterium]|nr:hypothetical protein [Patescibacteria group bacterium]